MLTPPLLARAVALHQRDLRGEVARDRQARQAIVGTRTRGGFFHLTVRVPRAEHAPARSWTPRPAGT
ncbi:MAG: hypothetical protein ACRDJC_15115 [Thermomicrobiales bacterium]